MDKVYGSATTIGFVFLILIGNAILATDEGLAMDSQAKEWYERRGSDLAACKGNLACIDKVKTKHRQETQATRDFLNAPIDWDSLNSRGKNETRREKTRTDNRQVPEKQEGTNSRSLQEQGSPKSSAKTGEFQLGDLDF